jgi:hypothetical protein
MENAKKASKLPRPMLEAKVRASAECEVTYAMAVWKDTENRALKDAK